MSTNLFNLQIRQTAINFIELKSNRIFFAPIYQRRYSWTESEISTFFHDIIISGSEYNFFGIVILKNVTTGRGQTVSKFEVIDGQQRFTSFFLLIKAIELTTAKKMTSKDKTKAESLIKKTNELLFTDNNNSYTPTLKDQDDYFEIVKLNYQANKTEDLINRKSSKSNFFFSLKYFMEQLKDFKISELRTKLEYLLADQYFIEVITKDISNVYELFKSLNAKGLELALEDLLKNELYNGLKKARTPEKDVALTIEKWDNAIDQIRNIPSFSIEKFLYYYINSRKDLIEIKDHIPELKNQKDYSPIPQKLLFKAYEAIINNVSAPFDLTEDFNKIIPTIKQVLNPENNLENEEFYSYSLLNALGVTKGISSIIAAKVNLKRTEYLSVLKGIELTCLRHNFSGKDQKALEDVFTRAIREIHLKNLTSIKNELKNSDAWKNSQNIKSGFVNRGKISNKLSKHILLRIHIDEFLKEVSSNWDYDQIQLEHVMPVSPNKSGTYIKLKDENKDNYELYCGMIGNHILLSAKLNNKLKNADFKSKKTGFKNKHGKIISGYKDKTFKCSSFIQKKTKWLYEDIQKRQDELAELLLKLDF
ncbi:MAG: DUF262 domain-containing HNH endonuclease family protein [Cryomorphaceae bacterium]|jgi:hypothetical protein|nr:DUF262 domain-containing HNH endonuclease family protein [Cryomorphaceae bacterium]